MSDIGFTQKLIDLTITLGAGEFGADAGDTVTITQSRIVADITNPGGETMGAAQIRVYGLSQSLMNQLTTIGQINRAIRVKNTVSLAAGDENGMQLVFFGVIVDAWAEYNSAPDVPFVIMANAGLDIAVKPVGATSYKGSVTVDQVMKDLAHEGALAYESLNLNGSLFNPYFSGTTLNKIRSCARAAQVEYVIDRGTLAVWSLGGSRQGEIPLINSDSGLVGYPTLSSKGMSLRTLFNHNVKIGSDIQVDCAIPMANGNWHVFNLSHNLSAQMPGGPWFTTIECYRVE